MLQQNIHLLSNCIKNIKSPSIIILHGAGVSVAAGIPDFRTPGTGFYSRVEKLNLPQPESIFDIDFFMQNPKPFYSIANELRPGKFLPTNCHFFSKQLEKENKLLRLYTQNIDGLEKLSGISDEKLCEAHGHFRTAHCVICQAEASMKEVNEAIDNKIPLNCKNCGGLVKPDIVFYGENLPSRFFKLSANDFQECQLLITIGTSLKVYPFASLVNFVAKDVPRFLINQEKTDNFNFNKDNSNDFLIQCDCQEAIRDVAEELGWHGFLNQMKKLSIIQ
ncbi:NAD-dependent protein deacetylase sirtuin-2 [Tritrichomonas foetus]|uniref:NAD-dependent protein deacetylase sirtuin-2 n=1 Tax=Tritrichomonas foetus TaxID=1144522 RepID=A0A1J4JAY0_9EUKA|nr:NAD-dependent protein deacetylase sirtuin-2 [Tritrichomonas foetus]|eukprot:OHS94811.1 NAD-dependent protein deacetylase sirtuin-2 [Tritrichomonas foetus]